MLLRLTDDPAAAPEPLDVVIDFPAGTVRTARPGDAFAYSLTLDRALVEWCILEHAEDWVNEIFLSARFRAHRDGPYNEYIYTFFKCLSIERMAYCDAYNRVIAEAREAGRLAGMTFLGKTSSRALAA